MARDDTTVVGVLGGTFDPVHHGHLGIARRVLDARWPDARLAPAAVRSRRTSKLRALTPAAHREAMLRLAVEDRPGLEICTLELDRARSATPSTRCAGCATAGRRSVPVFVLGMDSLLELPTWHEFRSLIREFDLVVVDRPGSDGRPSRLHPEVAAGSSTDRPTGRRTPRWARRPDLPPADAADSDLVERDPGPVARGESLGRPCSARRGPVYS